LGFALLGVGPAREQKVDLRPASHQRREPMPGGRLKARGRTAFERAETQTGSGRPGAESSQSNNPSTNGEWLRS
jgi:hypothetical protein